MNKILDGVEVNKKIQESIKQDLKNCMIRPSIAVVKIGNDESADFSVKQKEKICSQIGVYFRLFEFEKNTSELAIVNKIKELNNDEYVNGIMVELPLPSNYNERRILNAISNAKDIDGLTDINLGRLMNNRKALVPSETLAVFKILEENDIDLADKNVVIIGGLKHVNRSLISMCLTNEANVIVCQTNTASLKEKIAIADILIIGSDVNNLIDDGDIKEGTILIDLGVWKTDQFVPSVNEKILNKCNYTPVPNGIKSVSLTMLLNNAILCYQNSK